MESQVGVLTSKIKPADWMQKMRAIKRSKTRDKREQAHRDALRVVQHADTKEGPRNAAGRIPGAFAGESISKTQVS